MLRNNFDGETYTAITVNFKPPEKETMTLEAYMSLKDKSPRKRPRVITYEWLDEEITRAVSRDIDDNFYGQGKMDIQALADVSEMRDCPMILVFDSNGYLHAKVCFHRNDKDMTLNIMFLYVFGDRRRRIADNRQFFINGPYIIWYFAACFAQEFYGNLARLMICTPLTSIFKYIERLEARYVKILDTGKNSFIKSRIVDASPRFHEMIRRQIHVIPKDLDEVFGALFAAPFMITIIDQLEKVCTINRRM